MKLDPISCLYILWYRAPGREKESKNQHFKLWIVSSQLRLCADSMTMIWSWYYVGRAVCTFYPKKKQKQTELKMSTRLSNWNWRRIEVFHAHKCFLHQGDENEPHRLSIYFLQHDRFFLSSMCWLFTSLNETRQLWMANKFSSAESSKCFDDFVNGNLSNEWIMNASCKFWTRYIVRKTFQSEFSTRMLTTSDSGPERSFYGFHSRLDDDQQEFPAIHSPQATEKKVK